MRRQRGRHGGGRGAGSPCPEPLRREGNECLREGRRHIGMFGRRLDSVIPESFPAEGILWFRSARRALLAGGAAAQGPRAGSLGESLGSSIWRPRGISVREKNPPRGVSSPLRPPGPRLARRTLRVKLTRAAGINPVWKHPGTAGPAGWTCPVRPSQGRSVPGGSVCCSCLLFSEEAAP